METTRKRPHYTAKIATLQLKSARLQAFPRADYSLAWHFLEDMSQRGIWSIHCRDELRDDGLPEVLKLEDLREYRTTAPNAAPFV